MVDQLYQPYRSSLLPKEDLARLNKLRFAPVVVDIFSLWLQIGIAWTVAASFPSWWVVASCAIIVGNRYYSLYIVGHDGLHRRLHPSRSTNDFVNDVFVLGPLGAITRVNRTNHMRHHGALGQPSDPDAYKYAARWNFGPLAYLFSLTGTPFVFRALRNVYAKRDEAKTGSSERYTIRDIVIIVSWQIVLCAGLTAAFGWWGYIVLWWMPVYVFTFAADIARVFCEHSAEDAEDLSARLVTFDANTLELLLFAPKNMNHHVAHHLWPSIPYYNLPEATKLLYAKCPVDPDRRRPELRRSYIGYLIGCLRRSCQKGQRS